MDYIHIGIDILRGSLVNGLLMYIILLIFLWVTKKKKFKDWKSIVSMEMLGGYLLVVYTITILKITGIIGMKFYMDSFLNSLSNIEITVPFVGNSFQMIALNFFLFVPYGFLLPWALKKERGHWKWALVFGFVTSFIIEFLQMFAGRMSETDDLLINTLGTLAGYFLWEIVYGIVSQKQPKKMMMQGSCLLIVVGGIIGGLFMVAKGDQLQQEEMDRYWEINNSEEERADILKVVLHSSKGKMEIKNRSGFERWYNSVRQGISNNVSVFVESKGDYRKEDILLKEDRIFFEVYYRNPRTLTFLNNQELTFHGITHIIQDIEKGTTYFGTEENTFTSQIVYSSIQHPYMGNHGTYDEIKEYVEKAE